MPQGHTMLAVLMHYVIVYLLQLIDVPLPQLRHVYVPLQDSQPLGMDVWTLDLLLILLSSQEYDGSEIVPGDSRVIRDSRSPSMPRGIGLVRVLRQCCSSPSSKSSSMNAAIPLSHTKSSMGRKNEKSCLVCHCFGHVTASMGYTITFSNS